MDGEGRRLRMAVSTQIMMMVQGGQLREAKAALLREVAQRKVDPEVLGLLVQTLMSLGEFAQGEFYARRLIALVPDSYEAMHNLGNVLQETGKFAESQAALEKAFDLLDTYRDVLTPAQLASRRAMTLFAQGTCARAQERLIEAASFLSQAMLIDDSNPKIHIAFSNLMLRTGNAEFAVNIARSALSFCEDTPSIGVLSDALASMIHYDPRAAQEEIIKVQNDFGDLYTNVTAPKNIQQRTKSKKADQPGTLRIGVVSPDLYHHAVMKFFTPLVEHAKGVEWFFYHLGTTKDATTKWLQAKSTGFKYLFAKSSSEVAAAVQEDDLDLALDLAGHTRGNRLGAFSIHIAKVQGTYLGYPGSTGLRTMDIRFSDTLTEPPEMDGMLRERIVRLDPSSHCFREPENAPEVSPSPAKHNGHFTFGCFGAIMKHNKFMDTLLADVLQACPQSHLLIKHTGTRDEKLRERLRERLLDSGIEDSRLEIIGPTQGELDGFALVDALLDTFPYHGTTTTCESLYMGVPVITLRGKTTPSRVGCSLLHAGGMPEFIAENRQAFIALAQEISSESTVALARLAALRAGLRSRIKNSALMDGPSFANRFIEWCRVLVQEGEGLHRASGG